MGIRKNAYNILMRKSEGNTPLGRPKVRWENNIKIDFEYLGWDGVHLIDWA
jgi:hypothetical protein